MSMLSHLRFHRRGASNPTSPTPVSVPADGQSAAAALPQARMQGNAQAQIQSQHFQPLSQPKPRASSRSRSPHRSRTKSLLLSPSSFGGGASTTTSFDAADFTLPPIAQLGEDSDRQIAAKPQRASIAVPPSALSSNNNIDDNLANTRFIGGLALRNYQNRRHQAASSGAIAEPVAVSAAPFAAPPAANTSNATLITTPQLHAPHLPQLHTTHLPQLYSSHPHSQSKPPPPPINTNLSIPGGRYSLPAQPSPGFGASPASATLTPHHGKSPSFVTPTDMKSHQEMQQQLFAAAAAAAGSSTASGSLSKSKQKQGSAQQPHKKTKGVTFLRPVSTLLQRRRANNSVPDMRALRGAADEPTFDPRIKGNKVHDFSAPRPKKPVNATASSTTTTITTPVSATTVASVGTTVTTDPTMPSSTDPTLPSNHAPDTLFQGTIAPMMSMSTTTLVNPDPSVMLPPKDATSLPTSLRSVPSTSSATATKTEDAPHSDASSGHAATATGSVKSRRSRKISISEMSLRSSISRRMKSTSSRFSFDFIGADKQEKDLENKYRRRYPNNIENKEPEQPSAFSHGDDRFDGLDMDNFDYDAMLEDDGLEEEIPGLNLDYNEEDILEEDEDPFEYDGAYKDDYEAEDDDDVPHVGLGHMTLEDMEAADAARDAAVEPDWQGSEPQSGAFLGVVLEEADSGVVPKEAHSQEPLEAHSRSTPEEAQVTDAPSGLPTISETAPETDIVEYVIDMGFQYGDMASADSQNFGAFKFNRSNPGSELTSPLSIGLQSTPRDPEGRVIGFAISKDTPTASSSFLPLFGPEESSSSGLCIRMNSPLSSTGDPDPEAVPLEMQEQFQIRAPAYERLGGLAEEEKQFDAGANNEFADEFVTDEFTKGDDAGFDESLFDLDDTDQYGRPIPGAFASAQQRILGAREKQKRDLEAAAAAAAAATTTVKEDESETSAGEKENPGLAIPEPIMIPTFIPIHQAEAVQTDATDSVSVLPPDIARGAEMRGVGPETSPEHSRAYHAALLAATQKAFEDGKFKRESWASEALPENEAVEDKDNGLAGYEDEHDAVDYGYDDDDMGGGFNMADYENDDMDDYYDLGDTDDDRKIIEEANATALANDYDGWYGQEFGFYSAPLSQHHQLNNAVKYEYSNGGFFGPAGMANVSRTASGRVAVREPNLTPITERSEYSNRNSLMSLPGIPLPASALTSPGLAQLAMMSETDENLSLGALLRLRSKAWGGSQASSHQGSPRSERADGTHSPIAAPLWGLGSMTEQMRHMGGLRGGDADGEGAGLEGPLSAPLAGPTSAPAGFSFASNLTAGLLHAGSVSASTSPVMASAAQFQSLVGASASASGFPPPREFPLAPKAGATSGVSLNTALGYAAAGTGAGVGVGAVAGGTLPDLEEEEEVESARV